MFLILFGDPRLVLQESLLLKSTMTCTGMLPINMISTILQGERKDKLSFPNKLIQFDKSDHDPGEDNPLNQDEDDSSPYSIIQSSFNSPGPQQPTSIFIPNQLWGEFPELAKKLIIEYNKKVKVRNPKPFGGNPKPKPTLSKPNPKPQQAQLSFS